MKNNYNSSNQTFPIIGGGGGTTSKLIAILAIFTLSFISLTTVNFPTQQAQAATSPLCGPASGTAGPVTATTVTYGGKKFDIIGYNKNGNGVGVAGPNNSVTLLLDKDALDTTTYWNSIYDNTYQGSTISSAMNNFLLILGDDTGIIARTLTGGSDNQGTGGYNEDWIKGSGVLNQKIWPLSVDEASHLILSTRVSSNYWWLRSPGGGDEYVSLVGGNGDISLPGADTGGVIYTRPALYLDINSSVFSTLIFNENLSIGSCIAEPHNSFEINYVAETVSGFDTDTAGWSFSDSFAGLSTPAQLLSETLDVASYISSIPSTLFYNKATTSTDHFDSYYNNDKQKTESLAKLVIPARPSAPSGLTGVAPNSLGGGDGKITGTSNKMEYTQDPSLITGLLGSGLLGASPGWTDITGGELTGLTSGTYYVRTIADQSASKFKSFAKEVIVKAGSPPSSGPSTGPGSGTGPSAGDGGFSSDGTAQTGVYFAGLELLLALMLVGAVVLRRPAIGTTQPRLPRSLCSLAMTGRRG